MFWSLFQQIFTVLAIYSDERMNWSIFGWTAPSSWIGSIEPVWIILLSPVFAIMWTRLGKRAPTTPRKFAYGVIGMGFAFLLFLPMSGSTGKAVPALLVVGILAVFAVSELLLSPIGLSVTTKLAPEAFRAQMMALYFFSVGLGTSMSGVLARYYDPAREFAYFGIIGAVAIVAGVIVFALGLDQPADGGRALGFAAVVVVERSGDLAREQTDRRWRALRCTRSAPSRSPW